MEVFFFIPSLACLLPLGYHSFIWCIVLEILNIYINLYQLFLYSKVSCLGQITALGGLVVEGSIPLTSPTEQVSK